ncbi:DUF3253 domain-containing protein [Caulobacter sp. KR2-114]|uniref:DUF3253 domain-containing protein n=1 Tax=Caulobacter sp. KR2-114 TaxID=3400912 RepID=UPI003C03CC48
MASPIEDVLFQKLAPLAPGKSVSPEDVAKAVDAEGWRRLLPQVRATAVGLARAGRLVITRHGKPADPGRFKGVYRLRLPLPDDVIPGGEDEADDLDGLPQDDG